MNETMTLQLGVHRRRHRGDQVVRAVLRGVRGVRPYWLPRGGARLYHGTIHNTHRKHDADAARALEFKIHFESAAAYIWGLNEIKRTGFFLFSTGGGFVVLLSDETQTSQGGLIIKCGVRATM